MSKERVNIWGREFLLDVAYQNYPGEDITENQHLTLVSMPSADFDTAKKGVKGYIKKFFSSELGEDTLENLFRFVMPKSILITRSNDARVFALICNFKLDMEHGIAIIFENELYKAAGPQDLVL